MTVRLNLMVQKPKRHVRSIVSWSVYLL